jgi:hypothetical protein
MKFITKDPIEVAAIVMIIVSLVVAVVIILQK